IAIDPDDARRAAGHQRLGVPAEAERAIDVSAAALRPQETHRLLPQPWVVRGRGHRLLNAKLRQRARVVVAERLALQLRDEPFVVPDLEVVELSEDVDLARHRCRGAPTAVN